MIRLAKLPDRSSVRITFAVAPGLQQDLNAYATFYAEHYGVSEPPGELIPAIIASFLASDRGFQKWRTQKSNVERPTAN